MKLSDEIVEALMHQSGFSAESVLDRIIVLESDSELLADLIQMSRKGATTLRVVHNVFYVEYWDDPHKEESCDPVIDIGRETPKDAIAEAVKRWKGEKNDLVQ